MIYLVAVNVARVSARDHERPRTLIQDLHSLHLGDGLSFPLCISKRSAYYPALTPSFTIHSTMCLHRADDERKFIKYVLAFFASSDGIVIENLAARFMSGEQGPRAVFLCP